MQKETKTQYKAQSRKFLVLIVALALVVGAVTGGTLAWLLDTSDKVVNTFTYSDINITLEETNVDGDSATENNYQMVPGYKIAKDPKVTVTAGSEKCYVFVKLDKSDNYKDYLADYKMAEGWTSLETEGNTAVYYRVVEDASEDRAFYVLEGDESDGFENGCLTVLDTVTKDMMGKIKDSGMPTLTVQAFACQYYQNNTPVTGEGADAAGTPFTPQAAWDLVKPTENTGS